MKYILTSLSLFLLSSCTATYKQNLLLESSTKLNPNNPVIIATPSNGSYGNINYQSSGKITAQIIQTAFHNHTNNTSISNNCSNLNCLQSSNPYTYYVIPTILHWEDRATEWSGISDKIELKISIFQYPNTKITSTIINGKSKWATLGGDHPQDLLPIPINSFVNSLYQ